MCFATSGVLSLAVSCEFRNTCDYDYWGSRDKRCTHRLKVTGGVDAIVDLSAMSEVYNALLKSGEGVC